MLKILSLGILLTAQLALAALPPMDQEQREIMSQVVFDGTVGRVKSEIQTAPDGPLVHTDRVFTTDIKVSKVDKGDIAVGDTVKIRYWKPAKRQRGWVGSQGQNMLPKPGDQGRFYTISMDSEEGVLGLLEPTGWDRTHEGPAENYIEELEWLDEDL